ncbi:hypothetical protein Tco_0987037, partial [Tanacetum coccineum]
MGFGIMNGDGVFRGFKDVCNLLDETFLPKSDSPTRWVRSISASKINNFYALGNVSLIAVADNGVNLAHMGVLRCLTPFSCPIGALIRKIEPHSVSIVTWCVGVTR